MLARYTCSSGDALGYSLKRKKRCLANLASLDARTIATNFSMIQRFTMSGVACRLSFG